MEPSHFDRFERALTTGARALAAEELKAFIESFKSLEEKTTWSRSYLERRQFGRKIRHELYEHVIFPVLFAGYQKSDPWSLRWLEWTAQNLYQSEHLWAQVDMKTAYAFAKQLLSVCPEDDETRKRVLSHQLAWFQYCAHEWPAGILHGHDSATLEECEQILGEVASAVLLDTEGLHLEFMADFRRKVAEYKSRLTLPSSGRPQSGIA
jgi:hypothetical protein